MIKKDIFEIKKRFTKEKANFDRIAGCYVDGEKRKVCTFNSMFLTLEDEEFYKYLEIAKKALSGAVENNLLTLSFPTEEEAAGGKQHSLMALRESISNEEVMDAYFDRIIENYEYPGNYLIVVFHDNYDVMTKTTDGIAVDESVEVYSYIITAICPVELSKPALGYNEDKNIIESRIRDWVVKNPETAFLFPAFEERSTDIHGCLYYTKNPLETHNEFAEGVLGCSMIQTATEKREILKSILENEDTSSDEKISKLYLETQQVLKNIKDEDNAKTGEDAAIVVDSETLTEALSELKLPEFKIEKIVDQFENAFGEDGITSDSAIDERLLKAKETVLEKYDLEERIIELKKEIEDSRPQGGEIKITATDFEAEKLRQVEIDGEKYIKIPEGAVITVNGRNI